MIEVRVARPPDAVAIGAIHVAVWRTAYPGLLPDAYLARLSVMRQARYYEAAIRGSGGVLIATASGEELPSGSGRRVIGFATAGRARRTQISGRRLGDGEIETLYVLDDWRDRGVGRGLIRAAGAFLAQAGCRSAFLWVLRDNPSRWFYAHLGGTPAAEAMIQVGGTPIAQTAFVWDPIDKLLETSARAS